MAQTIGCPRCGTRFPNTRMGRIQLMSHWAKLQNASDPVHPA